MAVEIPVVIDIQGAFEEAARGVPQSMKVIQDVIDKNTVKIRVDNESIKSGNEELERLGAWYRRIENAEWSKIGEKLDLGPTINRAILELQGLEDKINEIQELRWSEGGRGDFSFAKEYNELIKQIRKAKDEVIALEEAQQKMSQATGVNFSGFVRDISRTNFELLQMRDYYERLEESSDKWDRAVNPAVMKHIEGLTEVNFELLQMREYYQQIEQEALRLSDSVNGYQSRISDLNERWNNMTKAERDSEAGRKVYEEYKKEAQALDEEAMTLERMRQEEIERTREAQREAEERIKAAQKEAEEKIKAEQREAEERRKAAERAAEAERKEQERINNLRKKGTQSRRYEEAVLNSTVKTIKILQEQERILSERLSRATIGSGKYNQLKKDLEAVRKEIKEINGDLDITEGKFERLLKNSLRLFAIHAGSRFVKNIREVTSEFELQRVALGSIIQDTERAEGLFRQIKAAAIESPFEIKDLVSYTKQLSAYQIETDKLFDTTMKLADVSAGLGVDMGRLILAFGQVRAAAVLRGQELRQFTEAGIPLVEKLAEKFRELGREGTTTADVFQLISERAVPFSMVEEIFNDMTSAGGMFYKMQEKQAETLLGQWNNLKDSLSIMYDEIGNTKSVHSAMETLIQDARSIMQNWRSWWAVIKVVGSGLASYYGIAKAASIATNMLAKSEKLAAVAESERAISMKKFVSSIIGKTAAEKISTFATEAHTFAMNKANAAATGLGAAFWRLTAAMLSNPFGVLAVAVGGLIALFTTLGNKTRDVQKDLENAEKSIQALNKTRVETANLIDEYDELSKKTEKSVKEQERLRDISRELAKTFPGATKGIDENTKALTLNVEELRKYNEEAEAAIRKGMSAQISIDEKTVAKNEKEIEKLTKSLNRGWGRNPTISLLSPFLTPLSKKQMAEIKDQIVELSDENESLNKSIQDQKDALAGVNREQANTAENLLSWQDKLIEFNSRTREDGTQIRVLTDDQIRGYSKLDAVLEDLAKQYNEESEQVAILEEALKGKNEEEAKDIQFAIDRAVLRRNLTKEILEYYNAFNLTQKKTSGGAHQTDPWITNMQDRIKFMQDFKKGYDDLKKYVSSSSALAEEAGIMLGRGTSLGLSAADQQRAAENLSGWYEDMIKATSARLRGKGLAGATVTDLLGIDTTKRSKDIQELQKLLQSLWDAKTDFDISQKKKDLEDALKRLSDEIKRSETARNFYKNILDLTGDEDLAATMGISVYGDIGSEFKDRLQKQLHAALSEFDDKGDFALWDKMREALGSGDFNTILKYLDRFPEEWQKRLKEMAEADEKYNADLVQNLMKTLAKSKTYGDKQVEIAKKSAERIAKINSLSVPQTVKDDLLKQNAKKEAEETARVQYEAFKESPMYIELFENLEGASTRMLTNMRENLQNLKGEWKNLSPRELRELQNKLDELDKQLATRNPFLAMVDSWKEYIALTKQQSRADADETAAGLTRYANLQKELLEAAKKNYEQVKNRKDATAEEIAAAKDELDVQAEETDLAIEQAEAAQETANKYRLAAKHIQDAADGMKEWAGYITDALGGVGEIIETFASDDTADTFNIISEGIGKTLNGLATTAGSVGRLMAGDLTAIPALIQGIGDVVVGIFGTKQKLKIKEINKQIAHQQDLLDDLSYEYDRLEKAMAKAFGSDYIYNYNKQLENLNAQIEAYNAQADLERGKGKKADADKIKEYENNARDAQDQITEMNSQLSEFFAGTDLTSAAKDFATSWIEAYKEFGSTTDAMKERFQDLIESMVTQSLGAKIMQSILQPLFDEIDAMAASGGELTTGEIAKIATEAPMYIGQINDAMTNLMNQLGAAGYNLRQGVGGFTGISRDIAGASEESITGLAAGINTQNFYMSLISQNVAAILAAMTGETVEGATGAAVPDPYKEQVLTYMGSLPQMRDDMYAIRTLLERVIKPLGTNATHYVATRM